MSIFEAEGRLHAVEAYWKTRRIRWSQRTHEQWVLLAEKADAAIIELEEKLSALKCDIMENPHTDREDELLEELTRMRERSCATCKFWTPYSFQEASGPREGTCTGPTYIEEPAEDFYCKSWEEKT